MESADVKTENYRGWPCVSCDACRKICPAGIWPQLIHRFLYAHNHDDAAQAGLADCTLCGRCKHVCPSFIDLPRQFAAGKAAIFHDVAAPVDAAEHGDEAIAPPAKKLSRGLSWRLRSWALAGVLAICLAAQAFGNASWWLILQNAAAAVLACVAAEIFVSLLRRRGPSGGAVGVGLAIAILLPAATPIWMAAVSAAFGMIFARELFGGGGRNLFHPAAVAICFLAVAYPGAIDWTFSTAKFLPEVIILAGAAACVCHSVSLLAAVCAIAVYFGVAMTTGRGDAIIGGVTSGSLPACDVAMLMAAFFLTSSGTATPIFRTAVIAKGLIVGAMSAVIMKFPPYNAPAVAISFAVMIACMCEPLVDLIVTRRFLSRRPAAAAKGSA